MKLPTLREIEEGLYQAIGDENAPREDDVGLWTKHIAKALCDIFAGVTVCGKGCTTGEYLTDFAGFECSEEDAWGKYRGLVFAAECEWSKGNPDGLWEDFIKLADVRADRKVFIGNLHKQHFADVDALLEKWANHLKNHRHISADEEILVLLSEKGGDAQEGSWIITAAREGARTLKAPHKRS